MNKKIINIILNFLITLMIVFIFMFTFMWGFSKVNGNSMAPNFLNKQIIIYSKNVKELKVGDVVTIHITTKFNNKNFKENIVKRVIALPGQELVVSGGKIFINKKQMLKNLKFFNDGYTHNYGIIPKNKIFVLGDNRKISLDSRLLGYINREQVFGKVIFNI